MLKKELTKAEQRAHWYIFMIGTEADRRRQGLAGAVLAHTQVRAREDGRPIWLEATTAYSRDLYVKHGFTVVGDAVLGKGKVGPDGLAKKDGEGVTVWGMVWRP